MRFGFKFLVWSLLVVLFVSTSVIADTIRLKDGSVLKGKVTNFKDGQFTVLLGDGARTSGRRSQLTVYMEDVEAIEFDAPDATTRSTAATTRPDPVETTAPSNNNRTATVTPTPAPRIETTAPSTTTTSRDRTGSGQTGGNNSQTVGAQPPTTNTSTTSTPRGNSRFISLNVKVLADATANGWTNAGLVVKKGQRLRVSANGRVSLGSGRFATPAGVGSLSDGERLMKTEPTGALIAVVGDDNNEFVFIGASREFVADRDGTLFLGINEGNLEDNSGAFDVTIEAEAADTTARR